MVSPSEKLQNLVTWNIISVFNLVSEGVPFTCLSSMSLLDGAGCASGFSGPHGISFSPFTTPHRRVGVAPSGECRAA